MTDDACPCWANIEQHGWTVLCGRVGCERGWRNHQRQLERDALQPTLDTFTPTTVDIVDREGRL